MHEVYYCSQSPKSFFTRCAKFFIFISILLEACLIDLEWVYVPMSSWCYLGCLQFLISKICSEFDCKPLKANGKDEDEDDAEQCLGWILIESELLDVALL